jgi:hypothetical protein
MRYALAAALCLPLLVQMAWAEPTGDISAAGAASAASRFAAIKAACPEAIPTDKVQADKFVDLYGEAGVRIVGIKAWSKLVHGQTAQRIREIKVTGPQRWCEDQRRYLREMGDTKVFP